MVPSRFIASSSTPATVRRWRSGGPVTGSPKPNANGFACATGSAHSRVAATIPWTMKRTISSPGPTGELPASATWPSPARSTTCCGTAPAGRPGRPQRITHQAGSHPPADATPANSPTGNHRNCRTNGSRTFSRVFSEQGRAQIPDQVFCGSPAATVPCSTSSLQQRFPAIPCRRSRIIRDAQRSGWPAGRKAGAPHPPILRRPRRLSHDLSDCAPGRSESRSLPPPARWKRSHCQLRAAGRQVRCPVQGSPARHPGPERWRRP
jgi:hypothetical protein